MQFLRNGEITAAKWLRRFSPERSLSAPRPMLHLSGDQDGGVPAAGVLMLEKKLATSYRPHGKPKNFRGILYKDTGPEYLPVMRHEMVTGFEKHLPP